MPNSTNTFTRYWPIRWLTQHQSNLVLVLPLLLAGLFYLFNQSLIGVLLYILGWYLGLGLMILDRKKLYTYYYSYIKEPGEEYAKLLTRNFLFILVMIPLSIFVLTSSGSYLGVGFVGGVLLSLALEMWEYFPFPEMFKQYFIQSPDKNWSDQEIKYLTYGFTLFTAIIILLSVI